jgi:hypothetical protein
MFGDERKAPTPAGVDLVAYESARAKAGRNAPAQVQLALWCEARGLTPERLRHLALAVMYDPSNTLARGLMGLVAHQGKWLKPEQAEKGMRDDPAYQALIREYLDRRLRTPHKADAQLRLAAWCDEKGLKDQAVAHYTEVTRLDPTRDAAWVHLGYKKHGKRWVKPDELAAQKLEAERQKRADQRWRPRLEKLREGLESTHAATRDKADQALAEVTDPRAVPMIWRVFGTGSARMQLVAVQLFGQIEGPAASFWLAVLAVDNPSPEVRRRATDVLVRRDPRDVIGRLITLVHKPYKYEVKPGNGPGSTGALFVDGERFDLQRFYRFPDMDLRVMPPAVIQTYIPPSPGVGPPSQKDVASAANATMAINYLLSLQRQMMVAAAVEATLERDFAIQQTLEGDVRMLQEANAQIEQTNGRVLPLLARLTGQPLGADPDAWRTWWSDQLGFVYQSPESKPTYADSVALPDTSVALSSDSVSVGVAPRVTPGLHNSCFAAGTLVQTTDGPRAIESIRVGDRVLSQNTSTGALSFHPVLATHLNGPSTTLRITIDGETIVATGIHRFWQASKGWTMARDLEADDRIRVIGGVVTIQSIDADKTQMVYNLDVAENRNFLVGKAGLLVHDYGFVQPVSEPFDRPRDLASLTPK